MLIALLFRYIFAFRLFSEVWLMTRGGPARSTEVVAVYLYLEAFRYNAFGAAAATGWLMVLASLLLARGLPAGACAEGCSPMRTRPPARRRRQGASAVRGDPGLVAVADRA